MNPGKFALGGAILAGTAAAMLCVPRGLATDEEGGDPACGPEAGDCFSANGTPGCDDESCCNIVCALDPFCCDVEWDNLCASEANDFCLGCQAPACSKVNVECLSGTDPDAYANRTVVGRLADPVNGGFCTAWLIAAPNIVLTNQHCVGSINPGTTLVQFNFECLDCPGTSTKVVDSYVVTSVLFQDSSLDIALLELSGDPASVWGVATVDSCDTEIGQSIYEIHHGEARTKGFDDGQVTTDPAPNLCIAGTSSEIGVSVIATQGASGSPVFDSANHAVVAVCHCGPPCSAGFAVPMSAIWPVAKTQILNAGGEPVEYCPSDLDCSDAVDINDLLAVLGIWGPCDAPCPPTCAGDVNNDCVVDINDLLALLGAWGPCD